MGRMIRYLALIVLVLSLGVACGDNNNGADPPADNGAAPDAEGPSDEELISLGGPIYDQNCARCHGGSGVGQGGTYPALAGNDTVTGDPGPVIEVVVHGEGAMPAFADELDDEEIAAVISYIRDAWGNDAATVSPSDVAGAR